MTSFPNTCRSVQTVSSSNTVSMGFSINDACPKTLTAEAPINHSKVEIGEAKKPIGTATQTSPVYSWLVLKEPNGVTSSSPFSLFIPTIPATTRTITKSSNKFVNNV